MKILICMRYAFPPAGGAEKALLKLSSLMKKEGHDITIFSLGYENKTFFYNGIKIREFDFRNKIRAKIVSLREIEKYFRLLRFNKLKDQILKSNPDLIITQHEISHLVSYLKKKKIIDCEYVFFIHGFEYLDRDFSKNIKLKIYKFILGKFTKLILKNTIHSAKAVILPSNFVKKFYCRRFKKKFHIIAPFPNLDFAKRKGSNRKYILHIKPTLEKGINVTLKLAKILKKEQFLIVGRLSSLSIKKEIDSLNNVRYMGFRKDMKSIYDRSKILIIPSDFETFSLSAVEAQSRGCNVIVTSNGGIPAPNYSKIKDLSDYNAWIRKINSGGRKLNQKELKRLDSKLQYAKFKSLIGL